jgi:hypothetical protein
MSGANLDSCVHVDADDTYATLTHSLAHTRLDSSFALSHTPNIVELFIGASGNPCNASAPFPTLSDYVVLVLPAEGTVRGEGGVFSTFTCNSSNPSQSPNGHILKTNTLNCSIAIQCASSNLTNCTFAYSGLIPNQCVRIGPTAYARLASGYVPPPNRTWTIIIGVIISLIAIGAVTLLAYLVVRVLRAAHAKRLAELSAPTSDAASINASGTLLALYFLT